MKCLKHSLFLNSQFIDFKSGIGKLPKNTDSNRMTAKLHGVLTDWGFFKKNIMSTRLLNIFIFS